MRKIKRITRQGASATPSPRRADTLSDLLDMLCDSYGVCGQADKCKGSNNVDLPIVGCVQFPDL